ncbi:DUF2096 family protein [Candidatus Bathyarchaeota archaeon]|nr:DUF2096 family protein [Candidatus Bathyarchaeota archaeon]
MGCEVKNMDYEAIWELMSNLIVELRNKGEVIPANIMSDLRAAKTIMEIYKVDQSHSEILQKVEEYLANLESTLFPLAEKRLGETEMEKWLRNLAELQRHETLWKPIPSRGVPVGVPREYKWMRIEPLETVTIEKVKHLAEQNGLRFTIQTNGTVLVFGEEQKLKHFVKNVAKELQKMERHNS